MKPIAQDNERFKLLSAGGPAKSRSTLEMMHDRHREEAVKNAIAITVMEGGEPSDYCREQIALFLAGEISVREMADRVVAYASHKPDSEIADS